LKLVICAPISGLPEVVLFYAQDGQDRRIFDSAPTELFKVIGILSTLPDCMAAAADSGGFSVPHCSLQ
jgi:hypothetical protein